MFHPLFRPCSTLFHLVPRAFTANNHYNYNDIGLVPLQPIAPIIILERAHEVSPTVLDLCVARCCVLEFYGPPLPCQFSMRLTLLGCCRTRHITRASECKWQAPGCQALTFSSESIVKSNVAPVAPLRSLRATLPSSWHTRTNISHAKIHILRI